MRQFYFPTPSSDNVEKLERFGKIHPMLFSRREAETYRELLELAGITARVDFQRGHDSTIKICITMKGEEYWISGADSLFTFVCRKTGRYGIFLKIYYNTNWSM